MKQILLILLIVAVVAIAGCKSSQYSRETLDTFATCLADKGVKEYGAFWCPNCAQQEKMFGKSYSIIKDRNVYVECDPRGKNEQAELCIERGIDRYPTWDFPSGERLIGIQQFEVLAEKAGCALA